MALTSRLGRPGTPSSERQSLYARAVATGRQEKKLLRYTATSVVAVVVSETTLLLLYGTSTLNATADAFIANLAGILPSYLLSRYWIWKDSPRDRVSRQVLLYWSSSAVAMVLTSFATGGAAAISPGGKLVHLIVVGSTLILVSLVLWVAKFVLYERFVFGPTVPGDDRDAAGTQVRGRDQSAASPGAPAPNGPGPCVDEETGRRLVWAAPGRDKATLEQFFDLLGEERSQLVKLVSADAAEWIATVVAERCPNATLCADALHMVAWATKALDDVRREIWRAARRMGAPTLIARIKGCRYALLKNPEHLTDKQQAGLSRVAQVNKTLYRAYLLN